MHTLSMGFFKTAVVDRFIMLKQPEVGCLTHDLRLIDQLSQPSSDMLRVGSQRLLTQSFAQEGSGQDG
ncbi:MAG: hypothetical protein KME45_10020 [Stenomitos rutilans HA7619-LM2]|nr:hypothetical protein [Stenomitos rutilans HA7619-LM2]